MYSPGTAIGQSQSLLGGLLCLRLLVSFFTLPYSLFCGLGIRPHSASEGTWFSLPALPPPTPQSTKNIRIQSFQVVACCCFKEKKKFIFTCGSEIGFLPLAAQVSSCSQWNYICSELFCGWSENRLFGLCLKLAGDGVRLESCPCFSYMAGECCPLHPFAQGSLRLF